MLTDEVARLREHAAANELKRIESEIRFNQLRQSHAELTRGYADAVAEVVRIQAKLRGNVSQADAASTIAEAEIARNGKQLSKEDRRQVGALLRQAGDEYNLGNFGGAMYLSNQAKSHIQRAGESLGIRQLEPIGDEQPFATPLPLIVSSNSNLRSGPGLDHPIVTTLPAGTPVEAYSHKYAWVRVRLADGSTGWLYQALVSERTDRKSPENNALSAPRPTH